MFSAKPFLNSSKGVMCTTRILRKKRLQHAYTSQHQTQSENNSTSRSEINMVLNDEEKAQLRTRIKIEGTIDKTVFEEFKRIYELEIQKSEAEDRVQPSISHILE